MIVPAFILRDFEVSDIAEHKNEWVVELEEKQQRIPNELFQCEDVVFDGFCHPTHILSHSFSLKPFYLKVLRRKWKRSNTDKHYSNTYALAINGLRMVPELGLFLKKEDRRLSGQHHHSSQDV